MVSHFCQCSGPGDDGALILLPPLTGTQDELAGLAGY
jgi:hypothetical protein